jgi:restriction system protein
MAIPDYQTIMLPLLQMAADRQEHSLREATDCLGEHFGLTEEELKELLPSGQSFAFGNRVGWARTYLKKAGLLKSTRRGHFAITDRGQQVAENPPERIDNKFLDQFQEFIEFRTVRKDDGEPSPTPVPETDSEATPEETLESAYSKLRESLVSELLQTISECSPAFFERLVIDLLVAMGYGGSRREAGQAVGRSGDGGIDGIIKEDRLGLDIIYVQAKRWEANIGRPEIQKFAGALQGQRARKGIFITTSGFSREAEEYAANIDSKIILIGGDQLANFMIDHNVGVSRFASYEVKRIDSDYFVEE